MSSLNETENRILEELKEVECNLTIIRSELKEARLKVFHIETNLIGLKLNREKLLEELRRLQLSKVIK